jgi:hypothetical protein
MGIIKNFLLLILVILLIGGGIFVGKRYLPETQRLQLQNIQSQASHIQQLQPQIQSILAQVGPVFSSAQQISRVLGIGDENNASGSSKAIDTTLPVHQQAMEKVRYEYCQQVVKDYQSRYSASESK